MPPEQNRASAGDLSQAIGTLPAGFKQEGESIICPSGLRWTLAGNGFDLSLRGNTIHVPYEEFMVVDKYAHTVMQPTGVQST